MVALQRLKEKIEAWKSDYEALKAENARLKTELQNATGSQDDKDIQIEALKKELEEKDAEIEKIITQVETLLS